MKPFYTQTYIICYENGARQEYVCSGYKWLFGYVAQRVRLYREHRYLGKDSLYPRPVKVERV